MLTILDEYTRECRAAQADRALKSSDVLEWIERAIAEHGSPAYLRSDNGPEFIAREVQRWLAANQIKTIYIEISGDPVAKRLRREFPWTLPKRPQPGAALNDRTRVVGKKGRYRCQYNHHRPHSKLATKAQNASRPPEAGSISGSSRPWAPYAADGQTKANNITNN